MQGDKKELEAKGKKVLKVGKYEKFAKTLLNPSPENTLYKKNFAQPLEIILLTNPADVHAGGTVQVQTLAHGKPAKLPLSYTYDQYSKEEGVYLGETETGEDGIATVQIPKAGLWMLRTALTEETSGQVTDKHVMRATYVFPVQ